MSYQTFANSAAPSTPASGKSTQYVDTTGRTIVINSTGTINTLSPYNRQNWIRNSGFWFAQRQAPGSATTYSATSGRAISADGWGITNENASATYQRSDTSGSSAQSGLQGEYFGNFLKITSTGKLVVTQVLEGVDTQALRGRNVRVTGWMKQLVGTTPIVRLGLIQLNSSGTIDTIPATYISAFGSNSTDPTLGTNLAYIAPSSVTGDNCTVSGNAASCTLSAAWQRFSAVFAVPSNCNNLIVSFWGDSQFAATNGFALAQVSLTDGEEIQDWSPQTIDREQFRVQRYYCKTFDINTAPTQSAGTSSGSLFWTLGKAGATALASQYAWRFPEVMRLAPATVTTYNVGASNAQARRESGTGAPVDQTATTVSITTTTGIVITATGDASGAVGDSVQLNISADAEL